MRRGEVAGDLPRILRPVDRLTLALLTAIAAIALARQPRPSATLIAIAALAAAVVVAAAGATRGKFGAFVHDFFPVVSVICIFSLCGPLIEVANPARWDGALAAVDERLFDGFVAAWRGALGRPWWLTDAASVAYFSYYVIPVAIAATLRARGRMREFEAFVFAVVATFFASYVGYFLVPTSGPRVPEHLEGAILGGGAVSGGVRVFLRAFEVNHLDAFPSGHTAISLVYLTFGWRFLPSWRLPLAILVAGIVFATVYLSLHYVVDVAAGVLLAALMPALLPRLRRLCGSPPDEGTAGSVRPVPDPVARETGSTLYRPSSSARHMPRDQAMRSNRPER